MTVLAFFVFFAFQQPQHDNVKGGLALEGYDVVSYFQEVEPKKGSSTFKVEYQGIKYLFLSQENKSTFQKNPLKYVPAYGGWCAYAMGVNGDKVKVDPETFKILDDRLFLFYNFWGNNTLKDWDKDEKSLKMKADNNWSDIIDPK